MINLDNENLEAKMSKKTYKILLSVTAVATVAISAIMCFVFLGGISMETEEIPASIQLIDTNIDTSHKPKITNKKIQGYTNQRVTVEGTGAVTAKPDLAIINLGVQTMGETAEIAYNDCMETVSAVIESLKDANIASNDIVTKNFSCYPQYNYNNGTPVLQGQRVFTSLQVTLRDVDRIAEIFELATASGANENFGIEYKVSDISRFYDEALKLALANAKGKAQIIMIDQNMSDMKLVSVKEGSTGYMPINVRAENLSMADFNSNGVIMPGNITVSAKVTATYKIS